MFFHSLYVVFSVTFYYARFNILNIHCSGRRSATMAQFDLINENAQNARVIRHLKVTWIVRKLEKRFHASGYFVSETEMEIRSRLAVRTNRGLLSRKVTLSYDRCADWTTSYRNGQSRRFSITNGSFIRIADPRASFGIRENYRRCFCILVPYFFYRDPDASRTVSAVRIVRGAIFRSV